MSNETMEKEISLTPRAIEKVKELIKEYGLSSDYGFRVGIKDKNKSAFKYNIGFDSGTKPGDTVVEQEGLKIIVDAKSLFYLNGTVIDYKTRKDQEGFKFKNPNATLYCHNGGAFHM